MIGSMETSWNYAVFASVAIHTFWFHSIERQKTQFVSLLCSRKVAQGPLAKLRKTINSWL